MKIALYFGSFNPIHSGHLIIASHVANYADYAQVWFIVSPQNPFKAETSLLNEYDRLHLVRLAVEDDPRLKVSDIEFKLPRPSYTIDTLAYLTEKYPQHEFAILMGSDGFQNLPKWKNADILISSYSFIVYTRPGFPIIETHGTKLNLLDAPQLIISATYIRETLKAGKTIRYLVPDKVRAYIEENNYYK
jgi:nicotinate-nucleotide adenylyltransferase